MVSENGFEPYTAAAASAAAAAAASASVKYDDVRNDDETAAIAAIPNPQVQVSRTEAVGTSAIVSEAVGISAVVSTKTSTTSPVNTSAITPSHPKFRATLQHYVGDRQERPQFLLPSEEAQNWGFKAD